MLSLRLHCIVYGTTRIIISTAHHLRMTLVSCVPLMVGALSASVTKPGEYADVMCILSLRTVTGVPMQSYFQKRAASFSTQPLTRCTVGRGVTGSTKRKV